MSTKAFKASIKNKLILSMSLLVLFQSVFFLAFILFQGVFSDLDEASYSNMNVYVSMQRDALQKELLRVSPNMLPIAKELSGIVDAYLVSNVIDFDSLHQNEQLVTGLMEEMAAPTLAMLRRAGGTGAFVVMDCETGENGNTRRAGMLFRGDNTADISSDYADVSLLRGPMSLSHRYPLKPYEKWEPDFQVFAPTSSSDSAPISTSYFDVPLEAYQDTPGLSLGDYGYWSEYFSFFPSDSPQISFSIPLVGESGQAYGVAGVSFSTEYLASLLQKSNLKQLESNYAVAVHNQADDSFTGHISRGDSFQSLNKESDRAWLEKALKRSGDAKTLSTYRRGSYEYMAYPLSLYGQDSLYPHQNWYLISISQTSTLYSLSSKILNSVAVATLLSLATAFLFLLFLSRRFVEPITHVSKSIRSIDPYKPIRLPQTYIKELDQLSSSVATMATNVATASSKVSTIIELTNLSVGVFEYTDDSENAFLSVTACRLLGIKGGQTGPIQKEQLLQRLTEICTHPEEGYVDVYRAGAAYSNTCWLQIKTHKANFRTLGTVLDVSKEVASKRKRDYELMHDTLTHLYNRQYFHNYVEARLKDENLELACMVKWDLDSLKYVNDTYGHDWGDAYISRAAAVLSQLPKQHCVSARNSGDEFFTLIHGYESRKDIYDLLELARQKMDNATLTLPDNRLFKVRISAGISWYPSDATTRDLLMRYADFAMYEVKNSARGSSREFDLESYQKFSFLLNKKEALNTFIDSNCVSYDFQPIVNVKTGEIFAYEALMRPDPALFSSPAEVLKLARAESKLYHIERQTIFNILDYYDRNHHFFGRAKIFINTIPSQCLTEKDMDDINNRYRHLSDQVVYEITENDDALSSLVTLKRKMWSIEQLGSQVAIDDFGSGYSNESTILNINAHFVKFDLTLIRGIDHDVKKRRLLKGLLEYTAYNNMRTIAEGVETREELQTVLEFGIDYAQGYFISKPAPKPQGISAACAEIVCGAAEALH